MRIFIIGCGAVAQCTLPILIRELAIDPATITIMDFVEAATHCNCFQGQQ